MKAVCTADAAAGIETLRLSCGGHGYMASSNFPATYGLVTAACTYEGENTVLLLQTSRYLLKAWAKALNNEPLVPTVAYLAQAVRTPGRASFCSDIPGLIDALQAVAAGKISTAFVNLEARKKKGYTQEEAANLTSIELAASADAHCRAFLVQSGYEMIEKASKSLSPALAVILRQIIELYAVETCMKSLGDLLRVSIDK